MAQPQPQSKQQALTRRDPEMRPVSGVRANEVDLINKASDRHYVLVDEGAGMNREAICPEMYEEIGYRVERWPKFEGLSGERLEAAKQRSLRFRGRAFGLPGEKMLARGHVLMSAPRELVRDIYRSSQEELLPIEEAIQPEKAARRLRKQAYEDSGLRHSAMGLDAVDDKDMALATPIERRSGGSEP